MGPMEVWKIFFAKSSYNSDLGNPQAKACPKGLCLAFAWPLLGLGPLGMRNAVPFTFLSLTYSISLSFSFFLSLAPSLSLSLKHTHTHTRTHPLSLSLFLSLRLLPIHPPRLCPLSPSSCLSPSLSVSLPLSLSWCPSQSPSSESIASPDIQLNASHDMELKEWSDKSQSVTSLSQSPHITTLE